MTNTKAQVGDLIRIVALGSSVHVDTLKIGGIYEVIAVKEGKISVDVKGGYVVFEDEYVIHRKAGEEDSETVDFPEDSEGIPYKQVVDVEPQDAVNSPQHYTQGRVEVIDVIEQFTSGYNDGFTAHCIGTATKYIARAPHKHATPLEDLRKAARYLAFAIEHEQRKTDAIK